METTEKALLTVKETASYLGIGLTKTRELMTAKNCSWTLKIGRCWYSNKRNLDAWLNRMCRVQQYA
ncbi:MAG: helix-turn-helix domain-containing protein [Eubacterium sp.]|nr:helix-turn-helix domain-containing protein [Eubacterium sp.]